MEKLYEILLNKKRDNSGPVVWILNRMYCPFWRMNENFVCVEYSFESVKKESPFSVDTIKDIDRFTTKTDFSNEYMRERVDILGRRAQDERIKSIWMFHKSVRKGNIMLFMEGHELFGYYVIKDDTLQAVDSENSCMHVYEAEPVKFDYPINIAKHVTSPFFKLIQDEPGYINHVIAALEKEINK